ncbi:MAG TPA: helix-turn-helix transcriptional regulator [Chloroflexota bacterium]|nr:helix-turn-helix transcriptional regulator [Chloroflexota bacterium]
MPESPPWNRRGYQRMARVAWQAPELVVEFEDGSRAAIAADRLLLPDDGPVEWDRLTWSPYEVAVPGPYEVVVIPWSRIRALTDPAYAAHLAVAAETEARQIGCRVRELRQARGLTVQELAERAGIAARALARIEGGEHAGPLPPIAPLLAAMGCTLDDLVPLAEAGAGEPASSR